MYNVYAWYTLSLPLFEHVHLTTYTSIYIYIYIHIIHTYLYTYIYILFSLFLLLHLSLSFLSLSICTTYYDMCDLCVCIYRVLFKLHHTMYMLSVE